jgi:hypothetical protein
MACPICNRPVTFGGGIGMTKGFLRFGEDEDFLASGRKQPEDSHLWGVGRGRWWEMWVDWV